MKLQIVLASVFVRDNIFDKQVHTEAVLIYLKDGTLFVAMLLASQPTAVVRCAN